MKNENYDDNENSMTAEEFLDFMRKNRRTVPNEKRIANKDKFIWAVSELSETYEIDADLIEDDDGYTASLYMNYASYNGYIKKLLGLIFILSDDFSVFEAKDNRDSDLLMCFTYHTHNVYLKDREITDLNNVLDGYSNEQPSFLICRNTVSVDNRTSNRVCFGSASIA